MLVAKVKTVDKDVHCDSCNNLIVLERHFLKKLGICEFKVMGDEVR